MISIVCAYNDEKILNTWLLKSLKTQSSAYEFIPINNSDMSFKSAAQALNYGGKRAVGKYIMFVHQDIDLLSPTFLENAEKILDGISNLGIAGIIGMSCIGETYKSRLRNAILAYEKPVTQIGIPIESPEEVQTVDECLFFIPNEVFKKNQFDEKTCDNWHFYAVDYCLSAKSSGYDVYILPFIVHHRSQGFTLKFKDRFRSISHLRIFSKSLSKLINKHKKNYKMISTTNGDYRTDINIYMQGLYILSKKLFKH